jgi:Flp pilus assembly protein TadG
MMMILRTRCQAKGFGAESGQSMVEFALAALVFFIVIFGIIDFGRAAYEYNIIASSAREGARMAIIQSRSNTDVTNRVVSSSANLLSAGNVTISGTRTCSALPCGTVTVAVTRTYTPATPLIATIVGNSLVLTASSTMVVER